MHITHFPSESFRECVKCLLLIYTGKNEHNWWLYESRYIFFGGCVIIDRQAHFPSVRHKTLIKIVSRIITQPFGNRCFQGIMSCDNKFYESSEM